MRLYLDEEGRFYYGHPPMFSVIYKIDPTMPMSNLLVRMSDATYVSRVTYRDIIEGNGLLEEVLNNPNHWQESVPLENVFREAFMDNEIKEDNVNHPKHYNSYSFEVIDIIDEVVVHFPVVAVIYIGNVIKYVLRAPFKGRLVEDLEKAEWYLHRAIEKLKKEQK